MKKFNVQQKKRKWCRIILARNGCKQKRCCVHKKKYGRIVYKKCTTGPSKCRVKRKNKCSITKYGKCHVKRCCSFTWTYRSKRWIMNKRICKYQKRCPRKLIKCSWRKLPKGCAQRFCVKTIYKHKKVFKIKKWQNKRVCYERRHYKCKYNKLAGDCRQKNCCLSVTFEGKILSEKCRNHRVICPFIFRRKCSINKLKNGCSRRECCHIFQRGGKITKKCRHTRFKCPHKIKTKCKTKKGKKCQSTNCCKFKYIPKIKFWRKMKSSCIKETKCISKKKRVQMDKNWKSLSLKKLLLIHFS